MADYPQDFRDYPYIDAIVKLVNGGQKFGLWFPNSNYNEIIKSSDVIELSSDKTIVRKQLESSNYILVPLNESICNKYGEGSQATWSIDTAKLSDFKFEEKYWSPIEDQIHAATCTAAAGVSLLEYFQRKESEVYEDLSKRFLYTVTRKLMRDEILVGATVRQTIAAMSLFGVPPEKYWQYKPEALNEEPDAFCYELAKNYRATSYIRLDRPKKSAPNLIEQIKVFIAAGYPVMFGLWGYESLLRQSIASSTASPDIKDKQRRGLIPFPERNEKCLGSHALIAVGFDDGLVVKYESNQASKLTTGAFRIRNSWGREWGEDGYGWLPYEHVLRNLTFDWWSILKAEYIDTTIFSLTENEYMIPKFDSRPNDPPPTR